MNGEIDVILPTLSPDIERFRAAVDSIKTQQNVKTNIFVIDDSEENKVKSICENDEELIFIDGPETTLAAALNKGIEYGEAPFIARHDADDLSRPKRFEIQKRELHRTEADIIGTGAVVESPNGRQQRQVKSDLDGEDFDSGNPIVHGSVMMKRDPISDLGGYHESYKTSEDIELWVRASESGYLLRNINIPLYILRIHDDSIYSEQLRDTKLLGWWARNRNNLSPPPTNEIYDQLSDNDHHQIHTQMATELLRYSNPSTARHHIAQAWHISPSPILVVLFLLCLLPRRFVDFSVYGFRLLKNRRITRAQ